MFAIEFLGLTDEHDSTARGRITVGEFRETFEMSLTFWTEREYQASWRTALQVLESGDEATSCLVSSMGDPAASNFIFCWPLYRKGEEVLVQNSVIFLEDLNRPFDPARPWLSVQPHESVDEDGNRISEWRTTMSKIHDFKKSVGPPD